MSYPLVGSVAGLLMAVCAHGGVINIGGGWEASWDASLDPYVNIVPLSVSIDDDAVYIEKYAEFIQAPPFPGFPFPTIPIAFNQIDPDAVSNIVIEQEFITNSTGLEWFDFHMVLLDGNDVFFDPTATAASGGPGPIGFDISPFAFGEFSPDNRQLNVEGAVIADGDVWNPGGGPDGGSLWINVNTGNGIDSPLKTFILKETPTNTGVPGPATFGVLGLGAVAGVRRRR